jgi:hypothetical protein
MSEDKKPLQYDLYDIIKPFKIDGFNIDLKGTASIKSQLYYSDYDILNIGQNWREFNKKIMDVVKKLEENPNYKFKEFKIQYENKNKIKYNKVEDINLNNVKYQNVDFIKLDYYIIDKGLLRDISAIYTTKSLQIKDFMKSMNEDINELLKEGNYFKVLKRYYSLLTNFKNQQRLTDEGITILNNLIKFFNSTYGELYKDTSILKTLKDYIEQYKKDKIYKQTLNSMNLRSSINLEKRIKANEKKYNKEAFKQFKQLLKD